MKFLRLIFSLKSVLLIAFTTLILSGCASHYYLTKKNYESTPINQVQQNDSVVQAMIQPYHDSLIGKMNEVIGISRTALKKEQPESTLGNFVCDEIMKHYAALKPDLCVVNYGGLRIPQLPEGNITTGKIFELMPFDNGMMLIYIPGKELKLLFEKIAQKNGWPVSEGVSLQIQNGKLISAFLSGDEIKESKTYKLIVSDYLANGGDDCNMLKALPHEDLKELFRNVLLQQIKVDYLKGEKIGASIEGRIIEVK